MTHPKQIRQLVIIVLLAALAVPAGDLSRAMAGPASDRLQAARERWEPSSPDPEAARRQLADSLDALDGHLAGEPHGDSWIVWLRLHDLRQYLASAEPDEPVLREIASRFRGKHPGLEYAAVRRVRTDLNRYLEMLSAASAAIAPDEAAAHLDRLAELVRQYEQAATAETHSNIAEHLAWLARHHAADPLVAEIRPYVSHPNLWLTIEGNVVSDWTRDAVARDVEVNKRDGSQITTGHGRLEGHSAIFPVPGGPEGGRLEIRFLGTLRTFNTTRQGSVRLRTHGVAPIVATRPVLLTAQGMTAGEPQVSVRYHNFVDGASTQFRPRGLLDRMVRKIAVNTAHRQRAEIEADAARDARRQFAESFEEEVAAELRESNDALLDRFRNPLLRLDLYPRRFEFQTSHEAVNVQLLFDSAMLLGAPHAPPAFSGHPAIGLRMHESCINNLAEQMLAGRLLMLDELEQTIEKVVARWSVNGGEAETPAADAPSGAELGIEFAPSAPLRVRFDGDLITVTLQATRYIHRERTYPPMNIVIRYRVSSQDGVFRAVRDGDPEYAAPAGVRGLQVIALRRILQSHINPRLEAEYHRDEVLLPDTDGEDEVGPLRFREVLADRGWLTVHLHRSR